MKITEPKTPYVRYNAELDTVENMNGKRPFQTSLSRFGIKRRPNTDATPSIDIPSFDLNRNQSPTSPNSSPFPTESPRSDHPPLLDEKSRTEANTIANARRPSLGAPTTKSGRSASQGSTSSRRTSFHLPEDQRKQFRGNNTEPGDEDAVEDEPKG